MERLNAFRNEDGLNINLKKFKCMIIAKSKITNIHLTIKNVVIERLDNYKYLEM